MSTTFNQRLAKLFDFSTTRLQEVLEIGQYASLYFLLGLALGVFSERLFQKEDAFTASKRSTPALLVLTCAQMAFDVIMIFYIHKIAHLVPFLFRFTSDYVDNFSSDVIAGGAVALAVTFSSVHPSLGTRISELAHRFGCDLCNTGKIAGNPHVHDHTKGVSRAFPTMGATTNRR